ncbi:hypothetical protein DEO72_LG5g2943 [Vigna unguiculata]|uniref:Uncharacterized protein n=1 Tax=Vigna unguiculata TaxID=3917 RepID=A0A4D6M477_VIGUN|nr:hypothetical protein DEO72_LG5g2943 [Vigna unguiculata]
MSLSKRFSFNNFFQSSVMFMDPSQDFLLFEEGFFLEWGQCLLMGTNYFSDPRGNVLNIEFEESLMAERTFRGSDDIVNFHDIYDIAFVCTLYCGDRYFRFRVFDIDWNEIEYPLVEPSSSCSRSSFSYSLRFFQSFRVKLELSKPYILLPEEFQKFCEDQLNLDRKVQLYDLIYKKFELYLDTNIDGIIILFSLTEFIKYYGFIQERESVAGLNNDSGGIVNNVGAINRHDFLNSLDGLVKKLTKYDVQTSSLTVLGEGTQEVLHYHFNFQVLALQNSMDSKGHPLNAISLVDGKDYARRINWLQLLTPIPNMETQKKVNVVLGFLVIDLTLATLMSLMQFLISNFFYGKRFQRAFNSFDSSPEKFDKYVSD